jgi:hypothetical protein
MSTASTLTRDQINDEIIVYCGGSLICSAVGQAIFWIRMTGESEEDKS